MLMRLGRADGVAAAGKTKVTVDYKSFATAFGADWASRLRLVTLPACALSTPEKKECAAAPLKSENDAATQTVSAEVAVSGTSTLMAATAAASGPAGDYAATSLSASSTWSGGGNTGDFTWNYPMRIPPSLGGPAPSLGLAYSAQSVDGRHAASNNQPSWIGEGFEMSAGGYVERRYQSCQEDMNGSANNDKKTGDLCWETSNATLSLSGHSGELIYNSTQNRWHLRGDDGTRIERKTGATNGDNDGEYWVVTTVEGIQYWFGVNRLPGWSTGKPLTDSTLTAPVFGNDPGEPCHQTAFKDSDCVQAWRWNLDYVVDLSGNSMSYWYTKGTNKYGRNLDADDAASYDREAWLNRIDYGTRRISGVDSVLSTLAPMRVEFTVDDRCLSGCDTHNATRWPDVPWDQSCTGDSCKDDFSPTFWSTKRLAAVTTKVRDGSSYRDVEKWTLTHSFPDPGDGTRAGLWLSKLSHTGLVGADASVPDVEFTPVQMPNRVDTTGDFAAAMNWMRVSRIRTDSGGSVSVVYSEQDCKAGQTMPNPATNTRRCYPVRWIPDGYEEPVTDWFNKYVVTTVYENDNTGGAPPMGSPRVVYKYDYYDGAAWHYNDDDGLIQKKYKTWSDYRGYGRVGVTVGDAGDKQSYTETRYFRGMNGDRLNADGGVKPVNVDEIADEDWFAGQTRETKTFDGPGGTVVSREVSTPWASSATASRTINGDTVSARYVGVESTADYVTLDGGRGERVTKTVNTYDAYGMLVQVDDLGEDGVAGDEQCIKTDYTPRNTTSWVLNRIHREQTYTVPCAQTTGTLTEDKVLGETRTLYDGQAFEATPTRGLVTQTQTMSAWNNGTPTFVSTGRNTYDVHGRIVTASDALDAKTTISFTPATDGPVTSAVSTNPLLQKTTNTFEPAWGTTTATVDQNDKRVDTEYDSLGRLRKVWKPGRAKGTDNPNLKYDYDINADKPSVVATSGLNAAGDYVTAYTLYDGLLRQRQTQSPSPTGGRTVTESFYDSAGRSVLSFGAYHADGNPGGTLLATTDRAFVPKQTRTVYDGVGRVVANVFQPFGTERWRSSAAYGGDRVDTTPPSGGTATATVVDARGRTVEQRQYHGTTPTPYTAGSWDATRYTFDSHGYQSKIVDTAGNDWTYRYDARGRALETDDPDHGVTTYTYDNAGNVLTSKDARGKTIAYLYDSLGRKRATYDDKVGGTMRAQWIYDTVAVGKLSQSTRFVGSAAYQTKVLDYTDDYLPGNTQVIIPDSETGLGGTYNYNATYNPDGSTKSISVPGTNSNLQAETLTYGYNSLGQPITLDSLYAGTNQPYVVGTDYNALGELDQVKYRTGTGEGGRVYTKYTREPDTGRLTGIRTDRDTVAPYVLTDTTYQYDDAGNIIKAADTAPEATDDTQCFTYDNLLRLTQAWTPENGDCAAAPSVSLLGGPAPYWQSWEFDATGNRTKEVVHSASGDATTSYAYPAAGSTTARPHAVTGTTGAHTGSYTYDGSGNMLTRPTATSGTQTLTWDPEGHLNTAADSTGTTTYIYDADGNRLVQRDPTGRTLYLPGQEIRYTNSSAAVSCTRYYSYLGGTVGSRTNTGLTWLSPDNQGTAGVAVSASDQGATTRRQNPYGTPRGTAAGAWPNNRGFIGGVIDNTGLIHLGAREYDPSTGRFVSPDPVQDLTDPQQWNGYAYANNSPITLSDPSGLLVDTGNGSGNGERYNPVSRKTVNTSTTSGVTATSHRRLNNGTTVTTYSSGRKEINGVEIRAGGPDIDALAAGVDRAKLDYIGTPCYKRCDSETFDLIFYACAWKYTECGDGYTWKAETDRTIQGCIDYGCPWREFGGGGVGMTEEFKAAGLKARADWRAKSKFSEVDETPGKNSLTSKCKSFSADTKVLMADGSIKEFANLEVGDEVLATDPESGKQGPRRIEAVWVHNDDLYQLTVGGAPIVTTEDHPFWNETDQKWEEVQDLDRGDLVRTPTGVARVGELDLAAHRYAKAYNLTIADIHTYYVIAGNTPVLVHNEGEGRGPWGNAHPWTGGDFPIGGARDAPGPKGGIYYRTNDQGAITNYAVYDEDGMILRRVDLTGNTHRGVETPHMQPWTYNENKKTGGKFPKETGEAFPGVGPEGEPPFGC
ncbi:intein N-terminal splicing region/RHS repeat-associated core domain-containing protein [Actinoplanes regularis]|uniref:Intein N-terminal splicing region/RHS repeat-associated core domain-containing protein n=2 Tax=Actinoplanes regularis TaxID=52697 RepID=A0A238V2C0_9ACTN|nr:intein N-terminal splicing region/RHS repeat-associated core domain-containing protein [Actinoplanes regularis]